LEEKENQMTTDQRERAYHEMPAKGDTWDNLILWLEKHYDTIEAALTATPHVPEEVMDILEKLAKLGAGEQYGNSIGNRLAQEALALLTQGREQQPPKDPNQFNLPYEG
jgi:hypothetical protein